MVKYIPCKWKPKESKGSYIYIRQNRLQAKIETRDQDGHYVMIKRSIHQEDITIINIYALNNGAPNYIKQILTDMKGEMDKNTIIVGELNTPLSTMDSSFRQKINK